MTQPLNTQDDLADLNQACVDDLEAALSYEATYNARFYVNRTLNRLLASEGLAEKPTGDHDALVEKLDYALCDAHVAGPSRQMIREVREALASAPRRDDVWNEAIETAAQAAFKWWDGEPEDAHFLREEIRALKQGGA